MIAIALLALSKGKRQRYALFAVGAGNGEKISQVCKIIARD